ncbi:MAG TPA: hypothetical protein VGA08_03185 [Candidatus Saccharimonadales bacterium]
MRFRGLQLGLISVLFFVGTASLAGAASESGIFEQSSQGFKTAANALFQEGIEGGTFEQRLLAIINFLLTFVGIIAFLLLLWAGWEWMMARGNEQKIEKSKTMVREIIIALIIIFTARLVVEFILTQIGGVIEQGGL